MINQDGPVDCLITTPLRLITTIQSEKIDFSKYVSIDNNNNKMMIVNDDGQWW